MNPAEKWRLHAYDYGWRRVFLNNHNKWSPIDPGGRWFDAVTAHATEQMYLAERPKRLPDSTSWRYRVAAAYRWKHARGETLPIGLASTSPRVVEAVAKYEAVIERDPQIKALAVAKAKIVGEGKNPDGSPSPEAIAFVGLCVKLAKSNVSQFVANTQRPFTLTK